MVSGGDLEAKIEALLNVEKQARNSGDVAGTKKAVTDILQLCYEAGAWKTLNEQIIVLSKRRGQLKQLCNSFQELFQSSVMARGKTKQSFIEDEKVLKSTFKKRKNGLIKKIQELTILCDIIACVIIYGPIIRGKPPEIFTWPEDQEKVRAAIRMYKEKEDHLKRTTALCNILKNRRRFDTYDDHHHHLLQVNNIAMSGGGVYETQGMQPEVALDYLRWVNARIKAVDERIELVKKAGDMMFFSSDQCHNLTFDDKAMVMPLIQMNQDGNFGNRFLQEWPYQQNPYADFHQLDRYVYDQAMCGLGAYPVPEASHFQQPIESYQRFQIPNQLCSYDPYFIGMEQTNMMGMSINGGLSYQQHQQERHGEKMQCLSSVIQAQSQVHPDYLMQLCPFLEKGSSQDAVSPCYSSYWWNQFTKATAASEDPLNYFLNTAELTGEIQALEDADRGNIPSQNGV